MDCLFCKIALNEIPTYTIYEDDIVKVFLDIHPHAKGHMLIVPKKHATDIYDIDKEVLSYIYKVIAPKMYDLLTEKLKIDGLTISQNNGIAQDIKHYHVHLIPKAKYDNIHNIEEVYQILTDK